jgi:excisionase family DNA binding protein
MYFILCMSKMLSTIEFAEMMNVTPFRVRQMIYDGSIKAEKIGRDWVINAKYVDVIKNRPERRGRKKAA